MDPCLTIFNSANQKLASIASSQSFKKLHADLLCFSVLCRHQGSPCHCLLLLSFSENEHRLRFEPPGFSLKFWAWKLKGKWRAKPLSLQGCTVIKHIGVGLCQRGPTVTKLSPGGPVLPLGVCTKAGFPSDLQVWRNGMGKSRGKTQAELLDSS